MICALAGKQSEVERGWLKPQGLEPPALGVLAGLSERVTPEDLGEVPPGRAGRTSAGTLSLGIKNLVPLRGSMKTPLAQGMG